MKRRTLRGLYAPELLEARIAPATFIVKLPFDAGPNTLRQAVLDANAHLGADTIVFDKALTDVTIALTSATIDITEAVAIKGPGIDVITVSGGDSLQIFNIHYATASLVPTVISGLSMIDGKSATKGGAIYSKEALTLSGVVIASSEAGTSGGGTFVNTPGKVLVTGSRIVQNKAPTKGGLYLQGSKGVTVSKSTISYNVAATAATGGLYARSTGEKITVLVDRCIIAQNTAALSGGGLQLRSQDTGKVVLKNTLVSGNTSSTAGGGLFFHYGNLVADHTTFVGNSAKAGGGMSDYKGTSVVIKKSRFLDNKATDAAGQGGGALYAQSAHPLSISGSLFAGNSSAVGGGAIAQHLASVFTVAGSTFIGNSAAGSGGAIAVHDGALFTMKGSTLSGNSGIAGGAIYANAGAHLTASGNKFTENRSTSVGGAIATSGVGAAAVPVALSGNLFSANVATAGGAIQSIGDGSVTMKGDKMLGNVTTASDGGGLYLASTAGITLTGLLVQGNHSFDDAGGIKITGTATLTGCKVLENIADYGDGRGGGIFVFAGTVAIAKSTVTGNVAATGGGIFDLDATTIPGTKVTGNSARTDPNTHGIP